MHAESGRLLPHLASSDRYRLVRCQRRRYRGAPQLNFSINSRHFDTFVRRTANDTTGLQFHHPSWRNGTGPNDLSRSAIERRSRAALCQLEQGMATSAYRSAKCL